MSTQQAKPSVSKMQPTSSELREQLRIAEQAEAEERRQRMRSIKKQWRFTIAPYTRRYKLPRPVSGVILLTLTGEVINANECIEAGHWDDMQGAMNYLFCTYTNEIVCAHGGGRVYILDNFHKNADEEATYTAIGQFMREHPQGGDITHIITSQAGWKE